MQSDLKFAVDLSFTTPNPEEAKDFLAQHEAQEIPIFTEAIEHSYNDEHKQFQIKADGQVLRFTHNAYLEFCGIIGIPPKFADKIPNDLLLQCVDEMLNSGNEKIRLLVRDKDVISGCKKDTYVSTNPRDFLFAADKLFENHLFREASVSDHGTSFLFEPMSGQMIRPNLENQEDRFNVGIAFGLGFGTGLIEATPYSLRHCCINVAITRSEVPKYNLVEKIKKNGSSKYYERLLENYQTDRYQEYLKELHNRIAKAIGEKITDWDYVSTYNSLNRLLGAEVASSLIGVDEDRHKGIMAEVKYKKARNKWNDENQSELDDLGRFEIMNSITAAGKGYSGLERRILQEVGGELI